MKSKDLSDPVTPVIIAEKEVKVKEIGEEKDEEALNQ